MQYIGYEMLNEPPRAERSLGTTPIADPMSAMVSRFNFLFRWFARRYFSHFDLDETTVERLRELETRGSVVFVMRYSSRLDYFLFNALFQRVGLRLSSFANGIRYYYYQPLIRALRLSLFRPRGLRREVKHGEDREFARGIALSGGSFFLFLRTARLRRWLSGLGRRGAGRQDELDLLEEVVSAVWDAEREVFIVPVSVFWRKGPRTESRFLNLAYGSIARPSDIAKVTSFLATYRSLSVKCGEAIDLRAFISERREEGPRVVARKVRRSIFSYLYREEKVVEGPTLKALHRIGEIILQDPTVVAAVEERARSSRRSIEGSRADAERMFREIAANMNSTFLAGLAWLVRAIFRRLFGSIEVIGLESVAEYAKRHPLVLVPSHRSYFDFLIITWLFYRNFLVPPHIAARENMAFGPFGFLFRRAGAFFMRRSFEDPLYKEVFRAYLAYLLREGFTQEFFIEGGRSRTGKMMAPRLGMLSWTVEAFLASSRRDLLFVPISITYERLVEEGAMIDELEGAEKTKESLWGLVRARKFLKRRFGSVHVRFGEPISLAESLGDRRDRLVFEDEQTARERRQFVDEFGHRIVECINWCAVANATSVASAVLLGSPQRGLFQRDFAQRMQWILDLLRLQGVRVTAELLRDGPDFGDSIAFLEHSDLIKRASEPRGEIVFFAESHRRALDLYRNAIGQYLAAPSFLARALLRGATRKELQEDLGAWQDLLYQDFLTPRGDALVAQAELLLDHFQARKWIETRDEMLTATAAGRPALRLLSEQTRGVIEAYVAVASVCCDEPLDLDRKAFLKRAAERFEHAELLGEAGRRESANETTFQNALDLLVRRRILELRSVKRPAGRPGRRATASVSVYSRGDHFEALTELRERLAAALRSG